MAEGVETLSDHLYIFMELVLLANVIGMLCPRQDDNDVR